ncbi:structural maintenance of chromosomes flexible hinge domain-containing protein 1-like [Corticium candelabrum]|uniref:structural maintenance of chromosomes flexible hinge domain-containing protein 1-like n=1 Tax=Corticium candelabrum TaxID=121492 RepID=UPI002E255488|nr:structural maintenance of chromosomes flexible hinge domain-containing protein 1-like [Corticium candelabrum]
MKAFDLSEESGDVESLYQLNARSSYNFSVDLRIQEKSGDRVYPVQGLLLYFPSTLADGETIPYPYDKHELFECFWQGRLIPRTVIPCLDFCKLKKPRIAAQRDKLPDSCFKRLKGMLFFDRTMLTGHNKLNLLLPSDMLGRRLNDCFHKREEKRFCDWLSKCHKCLDEEWVFCDETEVGSGKYRTLQLSGSVHGCVLRAGDYICVKRTNPHMYGKIEYFSKEKDSVFISRRPCKQTLDLGKYVLQFSKFVGLKQ